MRQRNKATTKVFTATFLAVLTFVFFLSCEKIDFGLDEMFDHGYSVTERAKYCNISSFAPKGLAGSYKILIVTDVHFGGEDNGSNGSRREEDFFSHAAQNAPYAFCACLGDIAEHGWDKEYKRYKTEFCARVKKEFGVDTFTCPGNHDLYNHGYKNYKDNFFPSSTFFSFSTNKISYYFLDDASGSFGAKTLYSLKTLFNGDTRKKIVFMHIPIYLDESVVFKLQDSHERNKLLSILNKGGVIASFNGHLHESNQSNLGNFRSYGIGGYLQYSKYAVATINEEKALVTVQEYTY